MVKRELQGLKGVGRVTRFGGVEREVRVDLDPAKLAALGITAADVNRQIRATNADLGGGRGESAAANRRSARLAARKASNKLAATKIALPGGRQVRLDDLAASMTGQRSRAPSAATMSSPVVTFAIFRAKGASDVRLARLSRRRWRSSRPPGRT